MYREPRRSRDRILISSGTGAALARGQDPPVCSGDHGWNQGARTQWGRGTELHSEQQGGRLLRRQWRTAGPSTISQRHRCRPGRGHRRLAGSSRSHTMRKRCPGPRVFAGTHRRALANGRPIRPALHTWRTGRSADLKGRDLRRCLTVSVRSIFEAVGSAAGLTGRLHREEAPFIARAAGQDQHEHVPREQ